jgi:hypothetical protein
VFASKSWLCFVGAGAARAASKCVPEPEQHKNDAAPFLHFKQCCIVTPFYAAPALRTNFNTAPVPNLLYIKPAMQPMLGIRIRSDPDFFVGFVSGNFDRIRIWIRPSIDP